jgi:AcrR family transcriptional regulator
VSNLAISAHIGYTPDMGTELTLREHARGAVRDEVMRRAWLLFAEQGFAATTVDQIAAASGMSRRTFFRYFGGKDELILERLQEAGGRIAAALGRRPAEEVPWTALRAALDEVVLPQDENGDQARRLQTMLRDESGVLASVEERRRRWLELLVPLLAERLPSRRRGPDCRAAAIVGSALACLDAAHDAWIDNPGSSLGALLDEAMGAVAPLG